MSWNRWAKPKIITKYDGIGMLFVMFIIGALFTTKFAYILGKMTTNRLKIPPFTIRMIKVMIR
jgi:hypothetical protein